MAVILPTKSWVLPSRWSRNCLTTVVLIVLCLACLANRLAGNCRLCWPLCLQRRTTDRYLIAGYVEVAVKQRAAGPQTVDDAVTTPSPQALP